MSAAAISGNAPAPAASAPPGPVMDRDFIARNQIVERYFANKLPTKGVLDFERYCRENPEILDELHVAERVCAGVRLMEAGGMSLPWEVREKRFWEKLPAIIALALVAIGASATALTYHSLHSTAQAAISALRSRLATQPLDPIKSTRSVKVDLYREGQPAAAALTVASTRAELADLKLQLGWSAFAHFRVTIDRVGQGRALVLNGLQRDSNGEVRIGINTSLFGPGDYQFQIEGVSQRGEYSPQGWTTINFVH
jgi:hypothetical protein